MTKFNLLLLTALILSCVYLIQIAHQSRLLFTVLDRAQSEERLLDTEHERLKSEKQSQATPLRVEKTAREKLAMRTATPAVTQYVTVPRALAGDAALTAPQNVPQAVASGAAPGDFMPPADHAVVEKRKP